MLSSLHFPSAYAVSVLQEEQVQKKFSFTYSIRLFEAFQTYLKFSQIKVVSAKDSIIMAKARTN